MLDVPAAVAALDSIFCEFFGEDLLLTVRALGVYSRSSDFYLAINFVLDVRNAIPRSGAFWPSIALRIVSIVNAVCYCYL